MSRRPDPHRLAQAGQCACGAHVLRGPDGTGQTVTVDNTGTDPVGELHAHTAGVPTYTLAWGPGLLLTRRTTRDMARRPPGFAPDQRVVLPHTCPDTREGNKP